MNTIGRHITNALDAGIIKSRSELARRIGVNRSQITEWIEGTRAPSAEHAKSLAEVIGAPAGMVMCEAEAQRAKDDATRAEWLSVARLCKRSSEMLAGLILVLLLWTSPEKAVAAQAVTGPHATVMHIIAVMRRAARTLQAALEQLAKTFGRRATLRMT